MKTDTTNTAPTDNSDLIRINDELAVSPRVYRIIQLIARTSWGDDIDYYLAEKTDHLLKEGRYLLHEYTYCVNHGITRSEYYDQNPMLIYDFS